MKSKQKAKKTPGPKKEIKRPSHKKPRPKKHVEAKIPTLPPIPAASVPVTKTPDTVNFEIPKEVLGPQTPEERFVELLGKAADELKTVVDNLEQPAKGPQTVLYQPGGIGAILRLEVGADEYKLVEQIAESLKTKYGWKSSVEKEEVVATEEYNPEPIPADPNDEMIQKVIHVKAVAAKQQVPSTPIQHPTSVHTEMKKHEGWISRALNALLGK